MSEELKPCPFCGEKPELPSGDGTQYEIECGGCGQAMAGVQICDLMTIEERAAGEFTNYRYAEEFVERAKVEAIANWNLRAQPAEAEGATLWPGLRLAAEVAQEDGPWDPGIGMTNCEKAFAQSAGPATVLQMIDTLSAVTAERDRLQAALSAPDTITAEPAGDYDNLRKQFLSLRMLANSNAKMVHHWRAQCGRETRETLLANAASVNAERDTNSMLTDALETAERERDQLRAEVAQLRQHKNDYMDAAEDTRRALVAEAEALRKDAERYVPLHDAIQRAAGELPEGWEIQLHIERHGGWVELIGPEGTEDFATNNERLDYTVIDALERAMAAKGTGNE